MSLKLTREQRHQIFAGEPPKITGEGECPVEAGYVLELSSRVRLTVLQVRTRKGGGWSLQYEVSDRRDAPRILRRTPGIHHVTKDDLDDNGDPKPLTADEIHRAAMDSAYTGRPTSLSDAGEAVDEKTQRRFSELARDRKAQLRLLRDAERQLQTAGQRLARVRREAEVMGVDLRRQEARLRGAGEEARQLEAIGAMERKLASRRAA
jgi:hypothetical protein